MPRIIHGKIARNLSNELRRFVKNRKKLVIAGGIFFGALFVILLILFIDGRQENHEDLNGTINFYRMNETPPSVVMRNGRLKTASGNGTIADIGYDRMLIYQKNGLAKIYGIRADIYRDNSQLYNITADSGYTPNMKDLGIIYLEGNVRILDLRQRTVLTGSVIRIIIDQNQLMSNNKVFVFRDGFTITADSFISSEDKIIFKSNAEILNSEGVFKDEKIPELRDLKTTSDMAVFKLDSNEIQLSGNVHAKSEMIAANGNVITIAQEEAPSKKVTVKVKNGDISYSSDATFATELVYLQGPTITLIHDDDNQIHFFNGGGYQITENGAVRIDFSGATGFFSEKSIEGSNRKKDRMALTQGTLLYRKEAEGREVIFYNTGASLNMTKDVGTNYTFLNGKGYLFDSAKETEIVFRANEGNYQENIATELKGNAEIYDNSSPAYIQGDHLYYSLERNMAKSEIPFSIKQYRKGYAAEKNAMTGQTPHVADYRNFNFETVAEKAPQNAYLSTVKAGKGIYYSDDRSFELEDSVVIADYDNLSVIKAGYVTYSGVDDDTYRLEKNVWVEKYDSATDFRKSGGADTVMEGDSGKIINREQHGWFYGKPRIKSVSSNFFIQGDSLEVLFDKNLYIFKNNVKFFTGQDANNPGVGKMVSIIGNYAVFDRNAGIITFQGPSRVLYENEAEMLANSIIIDTNSRHINVKGIKDTKILSF